MLDNVAEMPVRFLFAANLGGQPHENWLRFAKLVKPSTGTQGRTVTL